MEEARVNMHHKCVVTFENGKMDCDVFYAGINVKSSKTKMKSLEKFVKKCQEGFFDEKFCL